ncbi:hypothetical protein INR49_009489 [Caranx melampygus]|nr:hypothetical protein INR49_009489 [Caranx melampygus]
MKDGRSVVVIGAPKTNTSQSGVTEGGVCSFALCHLEAGLVTSSSDEVYSSDGLSLQTFKSQQWFGASVRSLSSSHLLACAPLFHWNAQRAGAESGKTPVGNCLLLDHKTGSSTPFSPCRGILMEADYKSMKNRNDQRYCEVGFSTDITKGGRLVVGAPGGFYFQGQVFTVGVSDIINSERSDYPIQYVGGISQSDERGGYDLYRGYSVASGQLTGDTIPDYLVGVPNDRNTAGTVTIYDGRSSGTLSVCHVFHGAQVASYFGHSVAVTDVNSDGFGSALAALGDLDMDGYQDVAIGAPWSGEGGRGQQDSIGFTLRGGADVDGNGYPDLLVGAWAADRAFVYRSQRVIRSRVSLALLPDFLNPDIKLCRGQRTPVSCFVIQVCVHVSGHRIPQETALWVDLQLDKMKQPMVRRTLLLSTNQPQEMMMLMVQREVGMACLNQTAYLRSEEEVQDKLSPIFITANISLLNTTQHALLYGQTHAAAQTRIILDCGDDNICVPDLKLRAKPGSSPPEVVLPLPDWQPAMHPGSLEEVGPLVEHVYETPYLNYELGSSASFDVINTSSKVQPTLLPSGHAQTQVSVLWRPPDGEKEVPIGYIILSIISGLLLLGLLCFIFWKIFSIVILGCVANEGYVNRPEEVEEYCIFNRNQNACNYAVAMGTLCFLCSAAFLGLDVYFPQISGVKDRKKAVMADIGVSAFWSLVWFVGFCFLANQWQVSKEEDNPLNEGADAARAAVVFSFFSVFTWVVQGLLALHRFKLGADSVTFNQDYVDPDQQNPPEATPTEA